MIDAFDYRPGHAEIRVEIQEAIARVLDSGRLILGPEVEAFEREFADFIGARTAVGVGSGTDAIKIALRALGVGPGDEVITVAHTAVATVGAICETGAVPRLVDIADNTLLMAPDQLEDAISPRTRAIVPVHLYGRPAPIGPILAVAERHGLAVVEDCAQAHGARVDRRHVGTFGAVGCFSCYPTKNLGAYGDGGLCATNDPALAERIRRIRFHGFDAARVAQVEGVCSRLDEIQAAILRVKLRHLGRDLAARRAIAGYYAAGLSGADFRRPDADPGTEHAWHLYVIRTPRRQALVRALIDAGIGYGIHYPVPVHLMPAYQHLGYATGTLPVTERVAKEVLSLPMYPQLTERDVQVVCQVVCRRCSGAAST